MSDDSHRHFDHATLRAALTDTPGLALLLRELLAHLMEVCPTCARELGAADAAPRLKVSARMRSAISEHLAQFERFAGAAPAELRQLMAYPPPERLAAMNRARNRYRNPVLVDLLVAESRRLAHSDPAAAYDLAGLAFDANLRYQLQSSVMLEVFSDLLVRAVAAKANAARARGCFPEANALLESAKRRAAKVPDPLTHAELLTTESSLRIDQRRFPEALACLRQARGIYEGLLDLAGLLRVALHHARVHYSIAEPDAAVRTLLEARHTLPHATDRLRLCWHHNLAYYLCDAERYAESLQVQRDAEHLYATCPDQPTGLRRQWLGARVAAGLGDTPAAIASLTRVRNGFIALDQPFDAAIATLDLAALYADQGDLGQVANLAATSHQVFTAHTIHADALAALLLFSQAAQAQAIDAEGIRLMAAKLRRAAESPHPAAAPS